MAISASENLPRLAPLSIARAVWKWRVLVLGSLIVVGSASAWVVRRLPNMYEASAVVLVDTQKIPEKFVSSTVQVSLQDSLSQIGQEVLSSGQLMAIIEELGLYSQERKNQTPEEVLARMRQDLPVAVERGITGTRSGAFRISYQGPDPVVVAAVVNRVADLFVRQNFRTREERANNTSAFMESALADAKRVLDVQEANLSKFKLQNTGELPEQQAALLGTLNRLQAVLQGDDDQISRDQATKTITENTLRFTQSTVDSLEREFARVDVSPVPSTTTSRPTSKPSEPVVPAPPAGPFPSDALRRQLETLRLKYSDEYREVKQLKKELDAQLKIEAAEAAAAQMRREQIDKANRAAAAANAGTVDTPLANPANLAAIQLRAEITREKQHLIEIQTQLNQLNLDIRSRIANRQRVLEEIATYEKHVRALPVREAQMSALTRDYDNSRANYRSLLEKKQSAEIANEMERQQQSERFTIADPARPPSAPVRPRRRMLYAASAAGSLIFGLILALGLELKRNTLLGEWELPREVCVLGRISWIDSSRIEVVAEGSRGEASVLSR
jgi:succinoglycan biosynthesis transport protein ExoP